MRILITGGAGYIGSHLVKLLSQSEHELLIYDNLSTGVREMVVAGKLVVGDLLDLQGLEATVKGFAPHAVIHLAALVSVEDSVLRPLEYYETNVGGTLNLLRAMESAPVSYLIFSSTAVVYGAREDGIYEESSSLNPISPYAASKLFCEGIIRDLAHRRRWRYIVLRYFNAAGADPEGQVGPSQTNPTHLIDRAVHAALGELEYLEIYGTNYPTRDGSCIRDYIHVMDIAAAHLNALRYLEAGGESDIFNVGYGRGTTVLEVIEAVKRVTGVDFPTRVAPPRPGDPPALIADSRKIRRVLHWKPRYDSLEKIIATVWEWEKKRRINTPRV